MKFETLLQAVNEYIDFPQGSIPSDCCEIAAKQLDIKIKGSFACSMDFRKNNPLERREAVYTVYNGEDTIYCNEDSSYKNFFVAREIAIYLLDPRNDNIHTNQSLNIMAAIIVAPPHLIKKNKIKNSIQLAKQCKIPLKIADDYWNEYKSIYLHNTNSKIKYVILSLMGGIIGMLLLFTIKSDVFITNTNRQINTSNNISIIKDDEYTKEITTETITANSIDGTEFVYKAGNGKKYHKQYCRYIKNSKKITKLSKDEAVKSGYAPCKSCFKEN